MQRPGDRTRARSAPIDPRGREHFPLIDPLRAVAALCVVCSHTGALWDTVQPSSPRKNLILDHLNVGVAIFFVISGFVLYRPFVAARVGGWARPSFGRYARRRFLRIAPAYWLALAVLAAVPGLAGVYTHNWWVYFSLLQIYPVYTKTADCMTNPEMCGLLQAWSLATEVAFYVALPLLVLAVDAAARRLRLSGGYWLEAFVLIWLGAASIVYRGLTFTSAGTTWTFNTILVYFDWFAAGMLLASASVCVSRSAFRDRILAVMRHGAALFWALAAAVYLLLCWGALPPTPLLFAQSLAQDMQEHLGFALIAVLLVAPAAFATEARGLARIVLGNPVMVWLGKISYGIFLWHLAIEVALLQAGAPAWWPAHPFWSLTLEVLAVTIPIAAVSYHVVERPILERLAGRRGVPVPAVATPSPPHGASGLPAPVFVAPAFAPGGEPT